MGTLTHSVRPERARERCGPQAKFPAAGAAGRRGRPPYGYRVTAGADRSALAVVPDEGAAAVVRRIFSEYVDGRGLQDIAEGLTADGIPSPSTRGHAAADGTSYRPAGPVPGAAWSKGTVRSILVNPRYTGGPSAPFQPIVPATVAERVGELFAARRAGTGRTRPPGRTYVLRGLVRCTWCHRLMQGTHNNGESYYRCRLPGASVRAAGQDEHPRNVYLREQAAVGAVLAWLRDVRAAVRGAGCELGTLPDVPGEEHAALFRSLGLHMTYTDTSRTLRVKAAVGAGGRPLSGALRL
ncbi:recombinase family protein [Streptomyces actinomycinicus]|uniref:Recombinase family protein n=1 Tax=Streptomyces actinomycinicus TaxID=1695166 RepID=A0A937JN72_9ACTN|nr:recombinase family protein [Streptomyces actinomycinicus]MBL1081163.1 recombinase family protein [Streptomyces actinomycinicus]